MTRKEYERLGVFFAGWVAVSFFLLIVTLFIMVLRGF